MRIIIEAVGEDLHLDITKSIWMIFMVTHMGTGPVEAGMAVGTCEGRRSISTEGIAPQCTGPNVVCLFIEHYISSFYLYRDGRRSRSRERY